MTTNVRSDWDPRSFNPHPSKATSRKDEREALSPAEIPTGDTAETMARFEPTETSQSQAEVKTAIDHLFENIEDVINLLRLVFKKIAGSTRALREIKSDEGLLRGLAAAHELHAQGVENFKAAEKQLAAAKQSKLAKLVTLVVAIVVAVVAFAASFVSGGATLAAVLPALMWAAGIGGLAFGGGMAGNAIAQGQASREVARFTYQASLHEAASADLQALLSKLKDEEERAQQDYHAVMGVLQGAGDLIAELRALALQNGF